jgi:hypothetical protein
MSKEDNRMMVGVSHYVFGTLMLMTERPDLVSRGSLQKRVKKQGDTKEFWSPNVIGENFRIRRDVPAAGGTHNSPRLHWVRGFWRQQAYGMGRELRREQWIEPFVRGN